MLGGSLRPALAEADILIDEATAAGLCTTSYPGTTGPDPLSPCQWDATVVNAGAAHAKATGAGIKVGVIDGGIELNPPDLAGAVDVAGSCSFIYSTTPTADPQEVANGDCSNKVAVRDLQGHGTHVATTIAANRWARRIVRKVPASRTAIIAFEASGPSRTVVLLSLG